MDWLVTAAGAVLVLFVLRDMFHTIWHPSGQGSLSRLVIQLVWRGSRVIKSRRRQSSVVGPFAILCVILTWITIILAGWTLVYWPHMSDGFSFGSSLQPSERSDILDSLYLSLVTVATLGYGDIVPAYAWLRLASPLEALIGFSLLTAAVTWILQIYPALARRRTLAIRLSLLRKAEAAQALSAMDSSAAATLLETLAGELVQVRVDLTQYAETYYFREADDVASLPAQLPYARELADRAASSGRDDVRLSGTILRGAVEDYAYLLTQQFLPASGDLAATLQRYSDDHGYRVS
ncbi:two pore domain potassium channel family protein [Blastococcus sp. MG754426]|uniref:potassium channel family protein n=1 Tax=unclassified Blastococcus TaxID=2619396 RepID=UPI000DE9ED40|nr:MULTISPECIES: potassium channel family protein [unclassified Blastococcus]MCF6508810.1 two pore domain potassium channel family protein [Blastococcus sp. MG754426]MCF6513495.1 two pore domain potassium channel family protein [Blastococcus sp. MG754427]MCF6736128.1 two pore domain potassium channel family protein [Blastococcus sp. KM273129]RBY92504.1 two pore domain potassium channel family protein [Blastococcus sp. TF02-8]